ncbi:MAG: DUF3800 domain-containing protein [Phycicoccus sp.]
MLLCFVDESDQGDFHGFAGLMADEHATKAITDSLNRIMRQTGVDWGVPAITEFHAHPIFHGKEEWKHVPTRVRVGVFHKVVEAVVAEDVVVLLRWVHGARLAERQSRNSYPVAFPPEQVCFQHILQRAQQVAENRDTHALIIADDRHDRERHRERFATYQTEGTPGVYMQTTLDRLLDTVHFAPSHRSRMLQAADMLAFVYRRLQTVTESDPRASREMARLRRTLLESNRVHQEGGWP